MFKEDITDTSVSNEPVFNFGRHPLFHLTAAIEAAIEKNKFVNVGKGSELFLGAPKDDIDFAVKLLTNVSGYVIHSIPVMIDGGLTNKQLDVWALVKPGVTYEETVQNMEASVNLGSSHIPTDTQLVKGVYEHYTVKSVCDRLMTRSTELNRAMVLIFKSLGVSDELSNVLVKNASVNDILDDFENNINNPQ
jgi:hypothetical protein